jgi:predicted TIM-barrel fold metal-dependent hydrolase
MTATDHIQVTHRDLPFSTFDADNHLYETRDALTKFLPPEYEGLIRYVDIDGRTKLAIQDRISEHVPNPTFSRVAVPGGAGFDVTANPEATGDTSSARTVGFGKLVAMPGIDAFFDPEPRLALMREMGIDRTLLWPTLVNQVEERLASDPDAVCAVLHAMNQWLHEHWSFVYEDAIYSTPIVSLAAGVDVAVRELEWIAERGARIFLIRVAPVPTWKGRKSFALAEFDPFWTRAAELGLVVGMHSGDSGYTRYTNEWEGLGDAEFVITAKSKHGQGSPAFLALSSEKNNLIDALASIIGHGLATRFPQLVFMPVEFSAVWIRPFYEKLQRTWDEMGVLFDENPVDVFNRNVWVHLFHERHPREIIDLGIPVDHLMFGSDFPHPEGMADPLAYSAIVEDLPSDQQALIMGGSLEQVMKV